MRIVNARDLGHLVREIRQKRGQTQAQLALEAGVSRRRLSDLEAGKATAEIGLVFRTLEALDIRLNASPVKPGSDGIGPSCFADMTVLPVR